MVINMTLGFATFDRLTAGAACGFACAALPGAACANAEHAAERAITTANDKLNEKVEKRANIRLVRHRLLLGALPLLVCFRCESLGGECLG